jgi:hypothetical protein
MTLQIEGTYLNIIKVTYDEPIVNIILNGGKVKLFPLKSWMKQGCPFSSLWFNIVLKFLKISQEEEIKGIKLHGRSQTIPICRWHDLIPKRSEKLHQKLLDIINSFSKLSGYKINLQKSVVFLFSNNEQTEKEYRKIIPFTIVSKNH